MVTNKTAAGNTPQDRANAAGSPPLVHPDMLCKINKPIMYDAPQSEAL